MPTSAQDQTDMDRVDALIAEAKRTGLDYSTRVEIVGLCDALLGRDSRHRDFVHRAVRTAQSQYMRMMGDSALIKNNPWADLAEKLESF